jgi:tRNA A-37 threonylcarbamoyl transferase component Bud32
MDGLKLESGRTTVIPFPSLDAKLASGRWEEMKERWQRGDCVPVEAYLNAGQGAGLDGESAVSLIYGEFILRRQRGENPDTDDYLRRFPQHGAALQRQFALHQALSADALPESLPRPSIGPDTSPSIGPDGSPALDSPRCPDRIGKYRVVAWLGQGGQATVYRAVHPTLGIDVALKIGRRRAWDDPADRDALIAEGKILAELEHPNLARVYDLDFHQGCVLLSMEFIRGRNLQQFARDCRPSPRQAARLIAAVARAVDLAHRYGVLHGDIKPGNILVDAEGRPRLVDFGLARIERAWGPQLPNSEQVAGTPAFMAPEQARGESENIGPPSDIFAVGASLYYLLTDLAPFQGKDLFDRLRRAQVCDFDRGALRTSAIPRRLRRICLRAMAPDPAARYPRAADLAADLEAAWRPAAIGIGVALVGVVLLATVAGLHGWGQHSRTLLQEAPAGRAGSASPATIAPLQVQVWRKDSYVDLTDAAPLRTGDEVQIRAQVPAGFHASLFLFGTQGRLRRLAEVAARETVQWLRYPPQQKQAVGLTGPAGSEVLLIVGRAGQAVDEKPIANWFAQQGAWPELPPSSILRWGREGVEVEQSGRDLGVPLDRPDPQGEVHERLDSLGRAMSQEYPLLQAVVFAHEAATDSR